MFVEFCISKVSRARITEAQLMYEGSITIDAKILQAAEIIPGQKVCVVNLNNGERFETYAITGKSGQICLNGPAARLGLVGDPIHILNYVFMTPEEAKKSSTKVISLDQDNKIKK